MPPPLARLASGPLVGRSDELAHAGEVLDGLADGGAPTLFIVGEAGVGKTRLAAAVAAEAASRGSTVVYGHSDEGLAAPHQPVVEAFAPWLADCPDAALGRLLGPGASDLVALWPDLASRLPTSPVSSGTDPETQRWRLCEAVTAMIRGIAAEGPVVIVVDDLQWAAPSTKLQLTHLVRSAVPGVALVATVRGGPHDAGAAGLLGDVGAGRAVDVLHLDGLGTGAVADLVTLRVGARPPDSLAHLLRRQTAGNPFFLDALLAHLDDVAFIRGADGAWVTIADLDDVGVPRAARDVIVRRLSLLGERSQRALEVAAVVGDTFNDRVVGSVLDLGADAIVDAFDEALAVNLVREHDAGTLGFVHALVRYAVLEGLSRARRAHLHWRIAEQLERDTANGVSLTGEIAYHFAAGAEVGDPAIVARSALAAGDEARQRVALDEAASHFRTALGALDRADADPDLRYRALSSLADALNTLADPGAAAPFWLQAADIARRARDPKPPVRRLHRLRVRAASCPGR